MRVELINGKLELLNDEGEVVTVDGEEIGDDRVNGGCSSSFVWRSFAKTDAGSDFYENYYEVPANQCKLIEVFDKLYPDGHVTKTRLVDTFNTALAAGQFVAIPAEQLHSVRDDRGRFADQKTLLRQEVRRMLADPATPAAAIRQRAATDSAFAPHGRPS